MELSMNFMKNLQTNLLFEDKHKLIGTIKRDTVRNCYFNSKRFSKGPH